MSTITYADTSRAHERPRVERRQARDRRRRPPLLSMRYWHGGRRRHARRIEDGHGYFVDRYEPRVLVICVLILVASGLDGIFTLALLDNGAKEINPVMASLLARGIQDFAWTKMALTALCLSALVVLDRFLVFRRVRVRQVLESVLGLYALLIGYELVLLRAAG